MINLPLLARCLGGEGASPTGAALGDLQVEAHALTIDRDCSDVNQLLPRAVIALVAAQRGEGEEELNGLRTRASTRLGGEMKRAAESQAVELGIILEVTEHGRTNIRKRESAEFSVPPLILLKKGSAPGLSWNL
jgi:hypothetical protein